MIPALWTAATGMATQQRNVNVIANNLANVNTAGFKRSLAQFEDLSYTQILPPGAETGTGGYMPVGVQIGHGARLSGTVLDLSIGEIRQTANPLDLFIADTGEARTFFQVMLPNGETAYTRDGSFKKDSEGSVVTVVGYRLEPPITVPQDATQVVVGSNGIVEAIFSDQPNQNLGQIQLVTFRNPTGLRAIGGNLFMATPASGDPITGTPGERGFGEVKGSMLEGSNVKAVEELISLIMAQRAFEMNSRSITTSDEMLQTTAGLRR
jgi:flagellar basal-body rod protein FlgG